MPTRLVLGCASVGRRVIEGLADRDQLLVIAPEESVVSDLRDEGVRAIRGDPGDPEILDGLSEPAVVFVAADRLDRNQRALEAVSERFPASRTIAVVPVHQRGSLAELETVADVVLDPSALVADRALDRVVSQDAKQAIDLRRTLAGIDGRLAVVTHDNPDPDAIASALALVDVAESVGVPADACYFGQISHQENRAMVNLLDLDLRRLDAGDSLGEWDGFALVDHSRPGVNDGLPEELAVDVVIDHHPPRGPVSGRFVDLRVDAGATSTILSEYLDRFGLEISRRTATALLYGIRVDTADFTRGITPADFQAAASLLVHADAGVLRRIESPTIGAETLETVARAIKNREHRGSVVVASAGPIVDRDALPQAAEQLLNVEGVETTLVFGVLDDVVFVSARSRSNAIDLGEAVRDAYAPVGSAGGHTDMAGAQVEVGVLGAEGDDEDGEGTSIEIVEEVITERFFEALRDRPRSGTGIRVSDSQWSPEREETDSDGESISGPGR